MADDKKPHRKAQSQLKIKSLSPLAVMPGTPLHHTTGLGTTDWK